MRTMKTKTICRTCVTEIADGLLVLDWALDGNTGQHAKQDCPAYALRNDYESRLMMSAKAGA